jgi:hypothetical protein
VTWADLRYFRINGAPAGGLAGFVLQLLAKTLGDWLDRGCRTESAPTHWTNA